MEKSVKWLEFYFFDGELGKEALRAGFVNFWGNGWNSTYLVRIHHEQLSRWAEGISEGRKDGVCGQSWRPEHSTGAEGQRGALGCSPALPAPGQHTFFGFSFLFFFCFFKSSATAAVVSTRHHTVAFLMHQFRWFFLCSTWLSLREEPLSFYIFILLVSVQFSHSVVSSSLWPQGLQHTRPTPTPRVYSNSCTLNWCTISSSVVPFCSHLQSSPASGSFQMTQFFVSGGENIGVSASASVLPMNIQDSFPLGWTGWISLQSKGLSRVFTNTTIQSINSLVLSFLYSPTLTFIHDYWTKP